MRMEKRKFRIGELAKHLAVERFVIRFWEKEFNVKSTRSGGGQRFYDEDDAHTFATIKELLYNRGFTIAGARKELPHLKGARLLTAQNAAELKEIKNIATPPKTTPVQQHLKSLKKIKDDLLILRELIETL